MRRITKLAATLACVAGCEFTLLASDLKLWYEGPASEWIYSLPVGNGRLLATNQGGVRHEVIQFNEDTIWSGGPLDRDKPGAYEALQEARQLIFDGEYKKAQQLVDAKVLTPHHAHGSHTYQTLGDLNLFFEYGDKLLRASEYRRELDLDTAISSVSYKIDEATFSRELFSSPADQAMVIRLACDRPGMLTFDAVFERPGAVIEAFGDNGLAISGTATDLGNPDSGGVQYEARVQFLNVGGRSSGIANGMRIEQADTVEIRVAAATDFRNTDPGQICERQLGAIKGKSYADLREDHIREHRRLFRRVELELPQTARIIRLGPFDQKNAPTDQRIESFRQGLPDPELVALYFQFGRYLLISSSRPGTQAINLWGKWINTIDPWYNADYHTNINIPMNYWLAQVANLPECHTPFFNLIDELRPQGRITARKTYGASGFVAHHATDLWRYTAAVGRSTHGMWSMTPAWGAIQMWQHYLFTGDRDYLADKTYPIIKEATEFIAEYLVEHPRTGRLVSGPSNSPENAFITPNGDRASLSMAPSMDMQLIEALFQSYIEASETLGADEAFRSRISEMKARLQPMLIGEDGRLMEWSEPFVETEPGHKHVSHLWGLCEGDLISPLATPELALAARKSLDFRVEHGSARTPVFRGNTAWIIQSYARLLAGDEAYDILRYLIANSSYTNLFAISVQGLRRKMWETDANLGSATAIAEMLLQSHAGCVHLLPALPSALHTGRVKGLRARGGFEVDIEWREGRLESAKVRSDNGGACVLRYRDEVRELDMRAGEIRVFDGALNET